jgi:hypothetical protein
VNLGDRGGGFEASKVPVMVRLVAGEHRRDGTDPRHRRVIVRSTGTGQPRLERLAALCRNRKHRQRQDAAATVLRQCRMIMSRSSERQS